MSESKSHAARRAHLVRISIYLPLVSLIRLSPHSFQVPRSRSTGKNPIVRSWSRRTLRDPIRYIRDSIALGTEYAQRPGPCSPIVPGSTRCMHEQRQKATRRTMYGARIWAWKTSRVARPGRDGEGATLAARVASWVSLIVRTQQHGREKTGGTGEKIRINYPLPPPMPQVFISPLVSRGPRAHDVSMRSPDGTDAARWACLAVHGEAFGHDYGQHTSGGPSPPHRTQATLACARWLVVLVQASYTPPTSTPTSGASTKAAHQDSSGDAQTESEVFHPYKRRTARGRGSSGLVILQYEWEDV